MVRALRSYAWRVALAGLLLLPMCANATPLTVKAFRELAPKTGEFEVLGYIAKQYTCPPCPPGSLCKPCAGNHVVVSQEQEILTSYPAAGDYLIVLTDAPEKLPLGRPYVLRFEVLDTGGTRYHAHDLRLQSAVESSGP